MDLVEMTPPNGDRTDRRNRTTIQHVVPEVAVMKRVQRAEDTLNGRVERIQRAVDHRTFAGVVLLIAVIAGLIAYVEYRTSDQLSAGEAQRLLEIQRIRGEERNTRIQRIEGVLMSAPPGIVQEETLPRPGVSPVGR